MNEKMDSSMLDDEELKKKREKMLKELQKLDEQAAENRNAPVPDAVKNVQDSTQSTKQVENQNAEQKQGSELSNILPGHVTAGEQKIEQDIDPQLQNSINQELSDVQNITQEIPEDNTQTETNPEQTQTEEKQTEDVNNSQPAEEDQVQTTEVDNQAQDESQIETSEASTENPTDDISSNDAANESNQETSKMNIDQNTNPDVQDKELKQNEAQMSAQPETSKVTVGTNENAKNMNTEAMEEDMNNIPDHSSISREIMSQPVDSTNGITPEKDERMAGVTSVLDSETGFSGPETDNKESTTQTKLNNESIEASPKNESVQSLIDKKSESSQQTPDFQILNQDGGVQSGSQNQIPEKSPEIFGSSQADSKNTETRVENSNVKSENAPQTINNIENVATAAASAQASAGSFSQNSNPSVASKGLDKETSKILADRTKKKEDDKPKGKLWYDIPISLQVMAIIIILLFIYFVFINRPDNSPLIDAIYEFMLSLRDMILELV